MYKKLTAKVQKIALPLPELAEECADTIVINPEDKNLILKKGTLYATFYLKQQTQFNTKILTNIIYDVLNNSYFQSENVSPIQSLEKAISEVKESLNKLANAEVDFRITAIVLWGSVIYIVKYGGGDIKLLRNNEFKNVNIIEDGHYSSSSGIIKDDDVVILYTDNFAQAYSPEKLFTNQVSITELPVGAACLTLKFSVDTSFSEDELIEFASDKTNTGGSTNIFEKLNLKKPKKPKLKKLITKTQLAIPGLMVLLVAAIFTTTRSAKPQNSVQTTPNIPEAKTEAQVEQPNEAEVKGVTTNTDKEIFYDLKITDANVTPTTIQAFNNFVVVTEKSSGKVFVSDTATPKFALLDSQFIGITNTNNYDGMLSFTDAEGYKIYDLDGKKLNQNYKLSNIGLANIYLDYLYAISGDKIMKYTKTAGTLTETLWGQNAQFSNAKSMSLAVSIYLITADNSIAKYTKGEKAIFDITGLDTTLNNPTQILADYDWKYIYIADSGNNRVVVLDENGKFNKELKSATQAWSGITSISVSPKEDYVYVLSGSKVYKVAL